MFATEIVGLIFAGVVAISTVFYVRLTGQLAKETQALRKVQTEPNLYAILEISEAMFGLIHIKIENIGLGLAKNLQFDLKIETSTPEAPEILDEFTTPGFFETGLKYFGPGQTITSGYTNLLEKNHESALNAKFILLIDYENNTGEKYKDEFMLDMAELRGAYRLDSPTHKLTKEVNAIGKNLAKLVQIAQTKK